MQYCRLSIQATWRWGKPAWRDSPGALHVSCQYFAKKINNILRNNVKNILRKNLNNNDFRKQ